MDPAGIILGTIPLLELVWKIQRLHITVNNAGNDWKQYCDGLRAVACMQTVIGTILSQCPELNNISIHPEGQQSPVPLVKHVNSTLSRVVKDAETLLKRHRDLAASWKTCFSRILKSIRFVMQKEDIASMLEAVEQARHHLHMALTMVSLMTSTSWQSKASNLLDEIKTDMAKHSEVLERLEKTGQIRHTTLGLETQAGLCHNRGLSSSNEFAEDISAPCSPLKQKYSFRWRPRNPLRSNGSQRKKEKKALLKASYRSRELATKASGGSAQEGVELGDDGGHDADNDSGDCEELLCQDTANPGTHDMCLNTPYEPEYVIIRTNGNLVQVPVDSETYRSAVGPLESNNSHTHQPVASTAIRIEEIIESLSDSEWDEAQYLPMEELMDFLTSAQSTAYATDMETIISEPRSPITIGSHCQSRIFIAQSVNLAFCRTGVGSTGRNFCIERVSVTGNMQVFCIIEPCADQRSPRCRHITMGIEDEDVFSVKDLPCSIRLASFRVREPSSATVNASSSQRDDSVASFSGSRCRNRARNGCRRHTVFDQDGRVECAMPVKLFASLQNTTDDDDAKTEYALSENEIDVDKTKENQYEGHLICDAGLPPNPGPDDDAFAFMVLKMMSLYDKYEPPANVELDKLIRFILLIDKYRPHTKDKALAQAKLWASRIQPSETFDKYAVPWLWIMWRTHMEPEFKTLSSIIQRRARSSISHLQHGPDNDYGIKLPELILNQLDEKRLQVLSTIRDQMDFEIEQHRKDFIHITENEVPWSSSANIMASSFAFGYLKLERDRCLMPQDRRREVDDPDFCGASFEDVKECITSMQELGDWKVCNLSIADRNPAIFAILCALPIPTPGQFLHNKHARLRAGFKDYLCDLIGKMEKQDWGIDLSQIGN